MPAVQVFDQDASRLEAVENSVCVVHAHQHEIGLRRIHADLRQSRQRAFKPRAFGADRLSLLGNPARVEEQRPDRGLRQRVHIIRLTDFVQLCDPGGRRDGVAQPDAGHADFRQRAQDQQIGELGYAGEKTRVGKRVIRLIDHH